MILLWGIPEDRPLQRVLNELQIIDREVVLVDQHGVADTAIELNTRGSVTGVLHAGGRSIELSDVCSLYARPYDYQQLCRAKQIQPSSLAWRHAMAVDAALHVWWAVMPGLKVNPLQSMGPNSSKPFQLAAVRQSGFQVPDTLVTTDYADVENFWAKHREIIYKSVSSVRSNVALLKSQDRERLRDVTWCPTQFQQFVPGTDVRVHVVGRSVFATEVLSEAVDYRYPAVDIESAPVIRTLTLAADVADRCIAMANRMDLPFAGIDLRKTPDGEWFCFEVNPSPGFSYYESATGQPIAAAVARLLMDTPQPGTSMARARDPLIPTGRPFIRASERPSVGPLPAYTSPG